MGTKAWQHELSAHSQRHTSKLMLKSLLDRTSIHPGAMDVKVVLPLVRTHASIIAGSAPNAVVTLTGIPSDSRSTLTNEEWRINAQLRLGLPSCQLPQPTQPHEPGPHGCKYPQTKEPVKVRYGEHLVTDLSQGKQTRNEATIIHHFNTYTSITTTKAKPSRTASKQTSSSQGVTTIDNAAARNWFLGVTSINPMRVTNQEFINRAALGHQPGPGEHDPRSNILTSAKRADEHKHVTYDAICAATGSIFSPFALETTAGTEPLPRR
jgi:hypothetical protein